MRLQFGGTLAEVGLTFLHPAGVVPPAPAHAGPAGVADDARRGFFRMRLRQLELRYQKRARGGFRLRVSAMPLDAYDLRGRLPTHTIGVVGKRVHGPMSVASMHAHEEDADDADGAAGGGGVSRLSTASWSAGGISWAAVRPPPGVNYLLCKILPESPPAGTRVRYDHGSTECTGGLAAATPPRRRGVR